MKMTHIDDVDGLKKKVCRKLEVISSKDAFPGLWGQKFVQKTTVFWFHVATLSKSYKHKKIFYDLKTLCVNLLKNLPPHNSLIQQFIFANLEKKTIQGIFLPNH